ncbi:MAG: integrin alpha [Myxococcota bacterium]|nr:integrin alpha [Myxococcota bacterium]
MIRALAWSWLVGCGGDEPDARRPADDACTELVVYADADGDGFGDPFAPVSTCTPPDDHVDNRDDCDDADPTEYPGVVWFRDVDGDGYGDDNATVESCHRPVGHIATGGDCDDRDGTRFPGGVWYQDADGDEHGDPDSPLDSCGDVSNAVADATDCDDSNWLTHPDANEICDGIDNDCDAAVDDADSDIDVFTQVPVFRDDDGDGYGTDELLGRMCPAASTGAPVTGDCDDADPTAHPYRLDYSDDHDADCDTEPALFNVSSTEGGWIGPNASSAFGMHLKSKDIDGDGLAEVLVSGHNYDTELNDVGSVYLVPGTIETDRTLWPDDGRWWSGIEADGHFGHALEFAGDWDGDGVEDLVVSAPYTNDNGGAAYIFSSTMDAPSMGDAAFAWVSAASDVYLGTALLGVGDINDDGLDDVLVSARKDDIGGSNRGSVTVVYGGSAPDDEHPVMTGLNNGDQLGWDIVSAGDMDGDGVPEVAISAPYADSDPLVNGGGDVYLIPVPDLSSAAAITEETTMFYGSQTRQYAGHDLAALGDFDGDGLDDLLIGSTQYDAVEVLDSDYDSDEGAAFIVLGSGSGWSSPSLDDAHLTMVGTEFEGKLGRYVGAPGDIDGDGKAEAFVTSHVWSGVEENMGLVAGVMGGHAGGVIEPEAGADLLIMGEGKNDYLGRGIAPAGDVNGDGMGDFWMSTNGVGAYGILYLVYGETRP